MAVAAAKEGESKAKPRKLAKEEKKKEKEKEIKKKGEFRTPPRGQLGSLIGGPGEFASCSTYVCVRPCACVDVCVGEGGGPPICGAASFVKRQVGERLMWDQSRGHWRLG